MKDIPLPPPTSVDLKQALKDAQRETIVVNGKTFKVGLRPMDLVCGMFQATAAVLRSPAHHESVQDQLSYRICFGWMVRQGDAEGLEREMRRHVEPFASSETAQLLCQVGRESK